jgi:hypothetical protein
MTRLAPHRLVLRDLGIRSKNKCAFPGCDHPILNQKNEYIAELCHIEAAEPGGERYNPAQSDEDRRSYSNLLFLCHAHHVETNDVEAYPVSRMQALKAAHESLPEVVFNHALLLAKVEEVLETQVQLAGFVQSQLRSSHAPQNYPIETSWVEDSWTPDQGRFYESPKTESGSFKLFAKDGWLHVEQTLSDGAVAYYEINEQGSVRNTRFPYPINAYRVIIPESLILTREAVQPTLGDRAVKTTLKWSAGSVTEHFVGNLFAGADCNARCTIDHQKRTINVVAPGNA